MSNKGFSGKFGTAFIGSDKICDTGKWTIKESVDTAAFVTNCSEGAKVRTVGAEDSTGTIEVVVASDGKAPFKKGDKLTLKLQVDAQTANAKTVPVVIKESSLDVDLNSPDPVKLIFTWEGDGPVVDGGILDSGEGACCGVAPS